MKHLKRFIAVVVLALLIVGAVSALPAETRTQPAKATQQEPFDHRGCQYPYRTTNPVNGCDNSDPCDPANVKGGSGECLPQPSTVEPAPTVTPAQPSKAAQCGGN